MSAIPGRSRLQLCWQSLFPVTCSGAAQWNLYWCQRAFLQRAFPVWQDTAARLEEEAAALRKQNSLLAAEAAGARDSVSQLLDRISGLQVERL